MKNLGFLLLLCTLVCSSTVFAQNPKQMQKHRKVAKSKSKAYKEPLNYDPKRGDKDEDGIEDYADHCPNTPKGMPVTPFGCPIDRDFDGTVDTLDACIDVPGPKTNKGCPWPDTDGDGINDNEDACPKLAGIPEYKGCPDRDGDGILDTEDKCPDDYGIAKFQGCPDTDNDGIADSQDKCPKVWGTIENKGCPPIKEEEQQAIQDAFDNLLFETGKAVIKVSSYESLDKLAEVMKNNPQAKLKIEGHTDNVGDEEDNQVLSDARAHSVKDYLEKKGANWNQISAQGFGESRPVATNVTPEGRKKNRRVEFILSY